MVKVLVITFLACVAAFIVALLVGAIIRQTDIVLYLLIGGALFGAYIVHSVLWILRFRSPAADRLYGWIVRMVDR
jgi:hypothetical protein